MNDKKTPLYYDRMYLGESELSAIYWGRQKIWKVPYPTQSVRRPLMVYPPETKDFTKNGICILRPISAVHDLDFGQAGEITVQHPIDKRGRWLSLTPNNIILAPCKWHGEEKPQAFRIYRTVKQMSSDCKKTITAYARHVFYDLTYSVLRNIKLHLAPSGTLNYIFMYQLGAVGTPGDPENPYFYNLASEAWYSRSDSSVRNFRISPTNIQRDTSFKDTTIASALIGEGSIAQTWGLEFYADNFYFSLLSTMENSLQNSFSIRYSHDMADVSEDKDYSNAFTHLFITDNFGDTAASSLSEQAFGPYVRPKIANFSYSSSLLTAQDNLNRLVNDKNNYFASNKDPIVTYTASYVPLDRDTSRNFIGQLDGREVGDTGTVVNTDLGISVTQRIIHKTTDLLSGAVLGIKLGNAPAYLTQSKKWANTVRTDAPSAVEKQIEAMQAT